MRDGTCAETARWRGAWAALALCAFVGIAACQKAGPTYDPSTDEGQINELMATMGDVSSSQSLAEQLFEKSSVPKPAERVKYGKYFFQVVDKNVTPESATLKVNVTANQGGAVTEKEWTAVKSDGKWKLKSAPLP